MSVYVAQHAAARALGIAEILQLVLEYFADLWYERSKRNAQRALSSLRLVNRDFARAAFDLVWKEPHLNSILRIPLKHRQEIVDKVSAVSFAHARQPKKVHEEFAPLHWPKLQSLTLGSHSKGDQEILFTPAYFQERLTALKVVGVPLSPRLMRIVERQCPLLQDLAVYLPFQESLEEENFILFIESLRALRSLSLTLKSGIDRQPVLQRISTMENLQQLSLLGRPLHDGDICTSFLHVKHLRASVWATFDSCIILPRFRNLEHLELDLLSAARDVCSTLARLENLTWLQVTMEPDEDCSLVFGSKEFRRLRSLTKMKHLEVHGQELEHNFFKDNLNDNALASVTSCMPDLQYINLALPSCLTVDILRILEKTHPELRTIDLGGSWHINDFINIQFPKLQSLRLRQEVGYGETFADILSMAESGSPAIAANDPDPEALARFNERFGDVHRS